MKLSQKQLDRFWSYVNKLSDDECWEWTSYTDGNYGVFYCNGKHRKAHRISWILKNGPIPNIGNNGKRSCILHKCDNPPCVNPNHLVLGTDKINSQDRERKGRRTPFRPSGSKNGNATVSPETVKQAETLLKNGTKGIDIAKKLNISEALVANIKYKRHWSQRSGET